VQLATGWVVTREGREIAQEQQNVEFIGGMEIILGKWQCPKKMGFLID
jgi:hypothetical protein